MLPREDAPTRPTIPLERMGVPDVLACVEPFRAARPHQVADLAAAAIRLRKPAGTMLAAADQVPDGLYVVLRGRVNLVSGGEGDRDLILSALGPGNVFGESSAFDARPLSTAAVTATPCDLLFIPGDVLAAHVRAQPETLIRITRLLHDKLRDAEGVASGLALCDVEQRLRRTLVRLVRRQGRKASTDAGWVLAPVPTQSELARMVGSCRETVSRTLSAMARDGLVSSRGRRMVLSDSLLADAS